MIGVVFRLIRQGLRDFTLNPWAQILTMVAVTLVAFLVGLFLMLITTLNYQLSTMKGETVFQVYWRPGTDLNAVGEQWAEMRRLPGLFSAQTYTPAQALKAMEDRLGRSASSKDFPFLTDNNPLPATALLTFVPQDENYEKWFHETGNYLKSLEGVERVASTPLRDELGQAWRKVNSYVMRPVILFLTLLLGLVVGNTVRLALLAKTREVEILKLVGAFNWYIRLPLIVCGAVHGFFGSALALVMLRFIHMQIKDVLFFPPLMMEIHFLTFETSVLLLLVPTLTGIVGGWIGLKR